MSKQKRVLFFAYEFPPLGGGVATAAANLIQEFAKNKNLKIDLITASPRNTYEAEKISANVGIYKVPIGRKEPARYQKQNPMEMWRYIRNSYLQATNLMKQNHYDFAHFFGYPGAWQGYWLLQRYQLPYLISLRGVEVPFYNPRFRLIDYLYRPLVSRLWQKALAVVTNSQGLADLAKQTNSRLKYQIIPNGVDTDFFKPFAEKQKFKKFTITAGGTILGRKKGLNYLIEAFAELAKNIKDVELLLIGEGDLQTKLQEQAEELGVSKQIIFVGRRDKNWLKENLGKCHIFCLPSLNEGMSNATLEAMACGLPIVITPVGGSQELLEGNGYLVPKFNALEIANKLELLYADSQLRIKMGKMSRNLAEKMSWQKVGEKYREVYENFGANQKT